MRKQCTKPSFAFSTPGSLCSSFLRFSSFALSSATSLETLSWERAAFFLLDDGVSASEIFSVSEGESDEGSSSDGVRYSVMAARREASWSRIFSSSD